MLSNPNTAINHTPHINLRSSLALFNTHNKESTDNKFMVSCQPSEAMPMLMDINSKPNQSKDHQFKAVKEFRESKESKEAKNNQSH